MAAVALLAKKEINFIGQYMRAVLRLQEKTYRNWNAGSACYKKDQQVISVEVNEFGNIEVMVAARPDIRNCNNAVKLVINPENLITSIYEGRQGDAWGPWGLHVISVD